MASGTIKIQITGASVRERGAYPVRLDGWLAPRRSPLAIVERSRGFLHLWVGPFGLHLARPLHRSRPDFCADWWR